MFSAYALLKRIAAIPFAATLLLASSASADQQILPGGCVIVPPKEGRPEGQCPLEHTDVDVDISGFIARVTLTQRFANPYKEPIEAVYTFPMSERSAVDTMLMKVGKRVIRGTIKEREEAQRIYEQARNAGKTASLLDQERPNIFTQSVANILPGENIEITISYVEYLKHEDGQYEFSFPMVVGPRYIPGQPLSGEPHPALPGSPLGTKAGPDRTDQVPDAGRVNAPITPEGTRAGHDISLRVRVDAGMPLQAIASALHEVDVKTNGNIAEVSLNAKDEIPNRDFVLTYSVAGNDIADAVLTHADAKGGFFTLVLQPPARVTPEMATPKEMIFVIDSSGSMGGFPIEKAKETMKLCIEAMNPNDTFNLVSFAGGIGYCFEKTVPNTPANRKAALEYLANLEGGGGTEMMAAIHAALGGAHDSERLRVVCFMTDGYIGNDMAILDAIQKNAKDARVFGFGIGNSVNRFLIEGMARAGRGAAEIVTLESDGDAAAKRFHERIHSPVLTDISVDFGGLGVAEVFPDPGAIPDLFSSTPLVLTGRYSAAGSGTITLRGQTADGPFERAIQVNLPTSQSDHDVLAPLWARQRIEWLMEQDWLGMQSGNANRDLKGDITKLGLEFGLMTQFTSFVAVEDRVVTEGGRTKTVEVPVEMPDGVSYEGIFGAAADESRVQLQSLGYAGAAVMPSPATPSKSSRGRDMNAQIGQAPATSPSPQRPEAESAPIAPGDSVQEGARMKDESDASSSKLDPALVNLASKLTNGRYADDKVTVENGILKVYVHLTEMSEDAIQQVKRAGATVISERRSNKMLLVRIRVELLEKLVALEGVTRITPV